MPEAESFGDRLLRARRLRRLSQEALGALVGVTGWTISRLERGHGAHVSPDVIQKLGRQLDVSLDWLFAMENPETGAASGEQREPLIGPLYVSA